MKEPERKVADIEKRPVALLDVDGTLIVSGARPGEKEKLNTGLLNALREKGITDLYLLTSMNLGDIVIEKANLDERKPYFSRPQLVRELTKLGFHVHGVITPADPGYNQGLGRAYRDYFLSQHKRVFVENEIKGKVNEDADFQKASDAFKGLAGRSKDDRGMYKKEKGSMYQYFLHEDNKPAWVSDVVFVDDVDLNVEDVIKAHGKFSTDGSQVVAIQTHPKYGEFKEEYCHPVQPLLSQHLETKNIAYSQELNQLDRTVAEIFKAIPKISSHYLVEKLIELRDNKTSTKKSGSVLLMGQDEKDAYATLAGQIHAHRNMVAAGKETFKEAWKEGVSAAVNGVAESLKEKPPKPGLFSRIGKSKKADSPKREAPLEDLLEKIDKALQIDKALLAKTPEIITRPRR